MISLLTISLLIILLILVGITQICSNSDYKYIMSAIYWIIYWIIIAGIIMIIFSNVVSKNEDNKDKIKITISGYTTEEDYTTIQHNHTIEGLTQYMSDSEINIER